MTPTPTHERLARFILETKPSDLPSAVLAMAKRCTLDLVGTAAAGESTDLSAAVRELAVASFSAGAGHRQAPMLFDGRMVSPAGAALAGGMTIDSFDAHDGHVLTKGHPGCAVFLALLATINAAGTMSGAEFLTALVVGYEVAIRAGISQHAVTLDYHTSGAWNALGAAAVVARRDRLSPDQVAHALGIAEYNGPRSPMMRCIDHPTMVKDGSGWGAMTGVAAAELAGLGFTGAPADVIVDERIEPLWADLGERWRILELYFKPYPVCRWAQPAIEAAFSVSQLAGLHNGRSIDEIATVRIETFREGTRIATRRPATTEEAQYSLPFPVAVAITRGRLDVTDVDGPILRDPEVLALADRIELVEDEALSQRFPAERLARVVIGLRSGEVFASPVLPARGDAERPLSDAEIRAKFMAILESSPWADRAKDIAELVASLDRADDVAALLAAVTSARP